VVTEVGAGLRELTLGGEAVLLSYGEEEMCRDGRGQLLAPWPNRLEDGTYSYGEVTTSAPLNEPARQNAIHGLYCFSRFNAVHRAADEVQLEALFAPQPGYPWWLRLGVEYRLSTEALRCTFSATNESALPAPFGVGLHPYFLAPRGADHAAVDLRAGTHLLLDDRGLPRGSEQAAAFAGAERLHGEPLGDLELDDCFGELERDDGGRWRVRFSPDTGAERRVVVEADAAFGYVMIYSADHLGPSELRSAVAIEPMTCPPNAFRSGEGLVRLEPEETFSASIGIAHSS
jgi:aldose 1-epimerase